jgi:hypothetical protein
VPVGYEPHLGWQRAVQAILNAAESHNRPPASSLAAGGDFGRIDQRD